MTQRIALLIAQATVIRQTSVMPNANPTYQRMPHLAPPATLQRIISPLTRTGYGLSAHNATLLILHTGVVTIIAQEPLAKPGRDTVSGKGGTEIFGPRLAWLPPGDAAELSAAAGTRAELLAIQDKAIIRSLPVNPLGEQIRQALKKRISLPLEQPHVFLQILDGFSREQDELPAGTGLAQTLFLGLVLLQTWRLLRADLIVHGRAPQGLAERFIALAGEHLHDHWPVGKYASVLGVSRNRLGTAVRKATGLSPQDFLHQVLLREASELLANTGMPVGQVGFRIGFSDPAYFSRFFHAKTGSSPGQFRRKERGKNAKHDVSYAAWP